MSSERVTIFKKKIISPAGELSQKAMYKTTVSIYNNANLQ